MAGEEWLGEIIKSVVEGTIAGTYQAFAESRTRSTHRILEEHGIFVERITNHTSKWLQKWTTRVSPHRHRGCTGRG